MTTETLAPGRDERRSAQGVGAWLMATDHKKIGLLYMSTALVFFLIAVGFAMVMRTQTIRPDLRVVSPQTYDELFSMHGTTMIFLFAMPMLIGLANYLVPLMIGARDMAFPRLNALSYWLFLFGGIFLYSSFAFGGGGLNTGWFSYAPLTEKPFSPLNAVTFWTLALIMLGASSLAGAVNFITTMLKLRAPGMSFMRMPLFAIATFVNSFLIVFAIPSLTAAVAMLYLDRTYGTAFYKAAQGGDPIIWQHLFWFFGHPEVYILILPAFGIISEVVPVFSRKPLFGRTTMVVMLALIGFLGFGVWGHHMFAVRLPGAFNGVMAGASFLIAIPTGVKIFNWIGTMWGGSLRFKTPLLFACGLIALFTVGGLSGVTLAVVPYDWQVEDTDYVVAHLHNVLFAGTVFAVFAGVYYWFPKISGRMLSDRLGKVHFWTILVGFMLTFLPLYWLGIAGMPRRVYTYAPNLGWNTANLISSIGGYIIATAVILFLVNMYLSLRKPATAGDNPWNAWTLEWATSSPPPPGNFRRLPPITGDRPLWDLTHPEQPQATLPRDIRTPETYKPPADVAAAHAPLPELSHLTAVPILVALAALWIAVGLLFKLPLLPFLGAAYGIAFLIVWLLSPWKEPEVAAVPGEHFSAIGSGMLVFLGSEAVLFGSLIYAYLHLRIHQLTWPPAGLPHLGLLLSTVNTVVLVTSGVFMHYAQVAFHKGELALFRTLLIVTGVLGAAFLGGQAWEYTHVGFGLSSGVMGSTFFTTTGFHGAHVTIGLLILCALFLRVWRQTRQDESELANGTRGMVDAATYYWHFVDAVWVVLFIVLYLL